jgi:hypothetical protein
MEAVALIVAGWVGFFFVMSVTARDESEKSIHQFIAGIPALIGTAVGGYLASQGVFPPAAPFLPGITGLILGGIAGKWFQDWRYART